MPQNPISRIRVFWRNATLKQLWPIVWQEQKDKVLQPLSENVRGHMCLAKGYEPYQCESKCHESPCTAESLKQSVEKPKNRLLFAMVHHTDKNQLSIVARSVSTVELVE